MQDQQLVIDEEELVTHETHNSLPNSVDKGNSPEIKLDLIHSPDKDSNFFGDNMIPLMEHPLETFEGGLSKK